MHSFLDLNVAGRVLDFPQGRVPCPLSSREREEGFEGKGGDWEEGRKCKYLHGKNLKNKKTRIKKENQVSEM